jgi:hypothetical protein
MKITTLTIIFAMTINSMLFCQNLNWLSQVSDTYQEGDTDDPFSTDVYFSDVSFDFNDDVVIGGVSKKKTDTDRKCIVSKYAKNKLLGSNNLIWEKEYDFTGVNSITDEYVSAITTVGHRTLISGQANGFAQLIIVNNISGNIINRANILNIGGHSRIVALSTDQASPSAVYAVGYFTGTIKFRQPGQVIDKVTLTSTTGSDIFIAKFTTAGIFINAIKISGNDGQVAFDIQSYTNGQLAISLYTYGTLSPPVTGSVGCSFYILKINPNFPSVPAPASFTLINKSHIESSGLSQIHNSLFPNPSISGTCSVGTEDINNNFRIDLDNNEIFLYYVLNTKNIGGGSKSIIGKLNDSGAKINEVPVPDVHFWDIKISKCDSVYVSVNSGLFTGGTGDQMNDFNNVSHCHLYTFDINLNQRSVINSSNYAKIEQIELNNKDQILVVGYYQALDLLRFNNDPTVFVEPYCHSNTGSYFGQYIGYVGLYHPGSFVHQNMITGPSTICPSKYPIKFDNLIAPSSNCTWALLSKPPQFDNPGNTISTSSNVMGGNNLWINNLNNYSQQFYVYCECKQNCNDITYDIKEVSPLSPLIINRNDITLNTSTVGGISTVTANYPPIGNPSLVYMWQLFEGETTSTGCAIKGENNGTSGSYLIREEYDTESSGGGIFFPNTNLMEGKSYVIKLGVYYQHPTDGTCGWYEARKCFTVASSSKKINEVKMKNFKNVPNYQKQ